MALIIRIDVDRPYGSRPILRHVLSRISSDLYCPRIASFGYLSELEVILSWLNAVDARAYAFFRRCTLPSDRVLKLLRDGGHEVGLHLENSRSCDTFLEELSICEKHFQHKVRAFSKHGSGGARYGFHHYAPYEPERYVEWAETASMRVFLGNLEDPTISSISNGDGLVYFPAAFWLEHYWRDTERFTVDWLLDRARHQDVVMLIHPENVLAESNLVVDFQKIIRSLSSKIL